MKPTLPTRCKLEEWLSHLVSSNPHFRRVPLHKLANVIAAPSSLRADHAASNLDFYVTSSGSLVAAIPSGKEMIVRPHSLEAGLSIKGLISCPLGQKWLGFRRHQRDDKSLCVHDLEQMPVFDGPDHLMVQIGKHLLTGGTVDSLKPFLFEEHGVDPTVMFFSPASTFLCSEGGGLPKLHKSLRRWMDTDRGVPLRGRFKLYWEVLEKQLGAFLEATALKDPAARLIALLIWERAFLGELKRLHGATRYSPRALMKQNSRGLDFPYSHLVACASYILLQALKKETALHIECQLKLYANRTTA